MSMYTDLAAGSEQSVSQPAKESALNRKDATGGQSKDSKVAVL